MKEKRNLIFIVSILTFSLVLAIYTNQSTLKDFPNSADEYSYLISAKTLSEGKISVPSPEQKEFFDFFHIINDGKFYSKYPLGWPLFLSIGILINFPFLINLIFFLLTLILIYLITKQISTEKTARTSLIIASTSPYLIFNSASYFSHPSALFFSALSVYFYLKNINHPNKLHPIIIGLSIGILLNIRPLDAIILSIPLLIHYLFTSNKEKMKNISLALIGFSAPFILFLTYNYLQTSSPFIMPFSIYNPLDTFGFNNGYTHSFSWAIENNILLRLIQLSIWVPLSIILIPLSLKRNKNDSRIYLFLAIILLFILVYFFYAKEAGNQYGPRYLFSSSFAFFPLISLSINNLKYRKLVFSLIVILNILFLIIFSNIISSEINERTYIYNYIENNNISNAIIFLDCGLCSGKMPAKDLARNDVHFNNSVLYVNSYAENNILLMQKYPSRIFYSWHCTDIKTTYHQSIDLWQSSNIDCSLIKIDQNYYKK
ncbi:MAG: glycosyltransferase family 39 protein [Nanoarchaeota archaeon]|nr:glycosyltransferase family 39 protein [Nanoarchaeota archaeon]